MATNKTELAILNKIKALKPKVAAYNELIDAKFVNVRIQRVCRYCGKIINKEQRVLTASHLIDKKKQITYTYAVDNNIGNCRYVKCRHWECLNCAQQMFEKAIEMNKIKNIRYSTDNYKNKSFDDIDLDNYSLDTQLDIISHYYKIGELSYEEYKDMQDAIIHHIALRDAEGIGQE